MAKFGKNLLVRTLSGAVILIVVVGAVMLSEYSFAALATVIAVGFLLEFLRLSRSSGAQPLKIYPAILTAAAVLLTFSVVKWEISAFYLVALIPLLFVIFIIELYRKSETPLQNITASIGGVFYAAAPMMLLVMIAYIRDYYDEWTVLTIFILVWANDVFAYLVGVWLGKHRLFERISPKKSWEGFFGGLIFTTAVALLIGELRGGIIGFYLGLGIVVVVGAVFGDLVESMLKRQVGVKDSGSIIPGHGGFMDRFDGLVFSVPFVYLYFNLF